MDIKIRKKEADRMVKITVWKFFGLVAVCITKLPKVANNHFIEVVTS